MGTGFLRCEVEDFQVDEELGFSPHGAGQHLLLRIRKRNTNTRWLARRLAHFAGVPPKAVGYAGLKDRRAVTTQWFSVDLAGRSEPDWCAFDTEAFQVLERIRHGRKLRRGSLRGNHFRVTLRQLDGEREAFERHLYRIREEGVPNYFGQQRFGYGGANLQQALDLFQGRIRVRDRHRRGLYLSASRSLLFNRVLAERVIRGCWREVLPGEAVMLAGSRSFFTVDEIDEEIGRRIEERDLLPSGPLWGRGPSPARGEAQALERVALQGLELWCEGLEAAGLKQERRPLVLWPERLAWEWTAGNRLQMRFFLPSGGYATTVLRELIAIAANP